MVACRATDRGPQRSTAHGGSELNVLDEAYIVVFGALKEHDERQKEEAKRKK